ncbi:hypothetical protein [Spiroplasma culicicola]|uniref:Uncharacterized protein n=1 Tax=Spiroplasma culicicola AES-1 TaxID=1276246 RepID=W6A7L4_9MOLU|nr:hypothetical protein [Spiroplasma culicicola]AHI52845.1 hypothetical protein SCULI_v1c05040 [Spiroplasma culicicola AES-1]
MFVKKILVKNFIIPGEQEFIFDEEQNLIDGWFYNIKELPLINELLNGKWNENTLSFEKYYPKFARKIADMDLQIDALIVFTPEELELMNKHIIQYTGKAQYSRAWYYSIKCTYPYIFPVVSLVPAENPKDNTFGIGTHYEKFIKVNSTKKDILTVTGMNAVGLLREKYFEYKAMQVRVDQLKTHKRYLDVIKSTYRYDEQFIKKIGQVVYAIDDGDVINYGDQADFFLRNKGFAEFLDSVPLLKENLEIKFDFAEMLYEVYLRDLQWIYSVKSSNDILEIRKIIVKAHCEKPLNDRNVLSLIKFDLKYDPKMDITEMQKEFIEDPTNATVLKEKDEPINMFDKSVVEEVDLTKYDDTSDLEDLAILKSSLKDEEKKIKEARKAELLKAKRQIQDAKEHEKRVTLEEKQKLKAAKEKMKAKELETSKKIAEGKRKAAEKQKQQDLILKQQRQKRNESQQKAD